MKFRGGEFSTGTMRNFQPELTPPLATPRDAVRLCRLSHRCDGRRIYQVIRSDLRAMSRTPLKWDGMLPHFHIVRFDS